MSTKELLLRALEDQRGSYVSGTTLAKELGVSRNSVWKAVESLRKDGYSIDAVTNKGYALTDENDLLSTVGIERFLPEAHPFSFTVRKKVDSTNAEASRRAIEGVSEGFVVVAEEQTAGRGRRGRPFYSPAGTGIYLSIVVRPGMPLDQAHYLTCAAAVACADAIERCTGIAASIKWVNDVYCRGKKVAGILTEGSLDLEAGTLACAVVGIGVNVKPPQGGFPEEIAEKAGALYDPRAKAARCRLVAEIVARFWRLYEGLPERPFLESYRQRCFLTGRRVVITQGSARTRAVVVDVDDDFKLIVELPDGTRRRLAYGEASIAPS